MDEAPDDDTGVATYQVPDYVGESEHGKEAVVIHYDELPAAFRWASNKYVRTSYTAHADGRATQNYPTHAHVLNGTPLKRNHFV